MAFMMRSKAQYSMAEFIREDNTAMIGKYLGYLDARELYPDFKPITFESFLDELMAGGIKRIYEEMTLYNSLKEHTHKP